jgi:hypothetical protein
MGLFGGRRRKLEEWAAAHGFQYNRVEDRPKPGRLEAPPGPPSEVFDQDRFLASQLPTVLYVHQTADTAGLFAKHPPRIGDVLSGTWREYPVAVFNFTWRTHATHSDVPGNSRPGGDMTKLCALAEVPLNAPRLLLVKETRVGRLMEKITGNEDVEIGVPELDERWTLSTEDPEFAKELLDPGMIDFLMQEDMTRNRFELAGPMLLVQGRIWMKAPNIEEGLNLTTDFADRIPPAVRKQWGAS